MTSNRLMESNPKPSSNLVPFIFLAGSSIFSGLALSIYIFTEQWYVVSGLNASSVLGLVLMATSLPRILLMPLGGVLADRYMRSRIMWFSVLIRSLLLLIMAFLLWKHQLDVFALTVFAFLFGSLDAIFWPARDAILPLVVSSEKIGKANSVMQTINQMTSILGPLLGGILISLISYTGSFLVVTTFLMISSGMIFFVKEQSLPRQKTSTSVFHDMSDGFRFARKTPFLRFVMVLFSFANFFLVGPLVIGNPIYASEILKGDETDFSFLQGSFSVGLLLGSILMAMLQFRKKRLLLLLGCAGLQGMGLALYSQNQSLILGMAVLLMIGGTMSVVNVTAINLIYEQVPKQKLGRVISLVSTVSMGLIPLSHGTVTLFLNLNLSITTIMFISGLVILFMAVIYLWRSKLIWQFD